MHKDSRCHKGSTSESVAAPVHPILGRDCYIERENIRPPKEKVTGDPRVSRVGCPFFLPPKCLPPVPGRPGCPKGTFPELLINMGLLLWPL